MGSLQDLDESSPTPTTQAGASADYVDTIQSFEVASCQGMPRQEKHDVLCSQNFCAYWP